MIEWRTVAEFPDYEVSEAGQLRRVSGPHLRATPDQSGYARVTFSRPGVKRYRYVHRLVALAFLGAPPDDAPLACHQNGDRLDNRASNLRYGTHKSNRLDAVRHGTAAHSGPRFNRRERALVHQAAAVMTSRELAAKFDISPSYARFVRARAYS